MITNSEIYIIGLAILIFLIITFLFIRKITNNGKLKLKIESIPETSVKNSDHEKEDNQHSINVSKETSKEQ